MLLNCGVGRSNQSILKESSPEYSLEGLMLKLKFQCFGHLMRKVHSMEKTLMLGKIEGWRRRGQQDEMVGWHHRFHGQEFEQAPGGQGGLVCCSPWGHKELNTAEWLNWTELIRSQIFFSFLTALRLTLESWNPWWLQHSSLLIGQEIFHSSALIPYLNGKYNRTVYR